MSRDRRVMRVLVAILFANLAVAAAKLGYGFWSGSIAIRADGFHSVVDTFNNVIGIIVVRIASAPPDAEHPYGHRKFEVIASLAIGVLIVLLLYQIGSDAVQGFLGRRERPELGTEAYAIMLGTLAINLVVAWLENRAAKRLHSPLLEADSRHTFSDIFVTIAVLAGIFGVRAGVPAADSIASVIVFGIIAWIGWGIFRQGVGVLADEVAIPAEELSKVAHSVPGVHRVHRVRSRGGHGDIRVDLIIDVDPSLSVAAAHELADEVERVIAETWPEVSEVVVHVEPRPA